MTIADPMLLPPDVELTPVEELPEEIRAQFTYHQGDHAVTRPRARSTSSIVDANTALLLGSFRTPTRIVDAVLGFASERQLDPRETLERSYPVLKDLLADGFLVPADSPFAEPIEASVLAEGAPVGRFRVVRPVQIMIDTQLYLARDEEGRDVALKVGRAGSDSSALFAHEARILRALGGRVAPRLIEIGEADGRTYLVVSWHPGADGESAAAELRRLPPADGREPRLELGERIIAAYADIHGRGVLHGDVHPSNVLVAGDGSVTVIDFGLATLGDERGVPRGGVDFFMEPESAAAQQAGRGPSALSAASEQYGLGAMLYRLLTGGYTHSFSLEPDEMRRQLLEEAPLPFASHDADDLPAVEAVLRRALSKDPADRFADTAVLLAAYRAAARSDLVQAPGPRHDASPSPTDLFLADVLERLSPAGPLLSSPLEAPRASVNLGAAGIAHGIMRMAMARDDEGLLALADVWSMKALSSLGSDEAFVNMALEITPEDFGTTGIHHSATGVFLTEALIANARGDASDRSMAIHGMVSAVGDGGPARDVSFGRSGILLGLSMLLDALPDDAAERSELIELGNRLATNLWTELSAMDELQAQAAGDRDDDAVAYLGAAHGWSGFLHAQLRWAESSGSAAPPIAARLDELARLGVPRGRGLVWPREVGPPDDGSLAATWCNGAAGMVFLWTAATRAFGDDRYVALAERAAWTAYEGHPVPGDLCCGLAGRAYALLNLHRAGGDRLWLARARDLAAQAVTSVRENALRRDSLYKGDIGVAALIADLDRTDDAAMPFYDRDA
jgi:eukaryotic-like serine/threonine-protein kinase